MKRINDFKAFLTKYPDMVPELAAEYGDMDALIMEAHQELSSDDHDVQSYIDALTNGTRH